MSGILNPQQNSGWDLNKQCHVRVQKRLSQTLSTSSERLCV